ncbi:MAG: hypothetical protein R3B59_01235 [Dehalococcoidia bacterium]
MARPKKIGTEFAEIFAAHYPDESIDAIAKRVAELSIPDEQIPERSALAAAVKRARGPGGEPLRNNLARVFFPETFDDGLLPWEAARPILDFIRDVDRLSLGDRSPFGDMFRPTVQFARWLYRASLAAPSDAPRHVLYQAALWLSVSEAIRDAGGSPDDFDAHVRREIESLLAYTTGSSAGATVWTHVPVVVVLPPEYLIGEPDPTAYWYVTNYRWVIGSISFAETNDPAPDKHDLLTQAFFATQRRETS